MFFETKGSRADREVVHSNRLGGRAFLALGIILSEALLWMKYGRDMFTEPVYLMHFTSPGLLIAIYRYLSP